MNFDFISFVMGIAVGVVAMFIAAFFQNRRGQ
jgi:hypothetical protein